MTAPVVSVLMAVYNAEAYLDKALGSLLDRQTLHNIEVLAVDDASTDESLRMLQRWAAEDARLHVFHQPVNQGQAVARNLALQHARGQFVTMLDADDWLSDDALQQAVNVFEQHPQTDCVLFRLANFWQEKNLTELPEGLDIVDSLSGHEAFRLSLDWRIHGLYMVRRDLHVQYPYDDRLRLYSDDNTTHLHYLHSRQVRQCMGTYYYRRHASSCTQAFTSQRFLHMQANLLLRQTLQEEGVDAIVLEQFDRFRWNVYRGLLWLFFSHSGELDDKERRRVGELFHSIYETFTRQQPYWLFLLDQRVRWRIRSLIRMCRGGK